MRISKKLFIVSSLLLSSVSYASSPDITGLWRSIDDKTGFSKAIIEVKKNEQGIYTGTIVEIVPRPGYTPQEKCVKCPAPYTNQPIVDLSIIQNMKADPKKPGEYRGGTVLDPLIGKVYKSHLKINDKGNRLTVRGYIGVSLIGRNQTWLRHTDAPPTHSTQTLQSQQMNKK